MKKFAIFGKSINYSKSPFIHKLFFKQFNLKYDYVLYNCDEKNFKNKLFNFLNNKNSIGVNITIPFKELSLLYCNILSNDSYLSKSVNVINKLSSNLLQGNNTDGIGLIKDLKRINFINKEYKILLIGAGGASRGIIPNICKYISSNLILTNRNIKKAKDLKLYFNSLNIKNIIVKDMNDINTYNFDLIINATSSSSNNIIPNISNNLINDNTKCYDLFYDLNKETEFIKWCKLNGSKYCADGLGMLIYQAAYSFYIWNNKMPNIDSIFNKIKEKL